jgi:HAD superfamily hydrolase (TIGR01484 family)
MHKLIPLSSTSFPQSFTNVRLVATDMDGTLTKGGKFTTELLQSLQDLANAGIPVIIVTGRSAGWVSGLAYYLPIAGAIAENGGLFYPSGSGTPVALTPIPDIIAHRQLLATAFQKLQTQFPQIQEAADNRFRITDWTFSVQGLSTDELQTLNQLCQQMGCGFTYSNVQCHIQPLGQEKATGLLQVLRECFPQHTSEKVMTVGDSPNDESLFDEHYFPVSVGVANVAEYANQLKHHPVYVTSATEVEGFCELVRLIVLSMTV